MRLIKLNFPRVHSINKDIRRSNGSDTISVSDFEFLDVEETVTSGAIGSSKTHIPMGGLSLQVDLDLTRHKQSV